MTAPSISGITKLWYDSPDGAIVTPASFGNSINFIINNGIFRLRGTSAVGQAAAYTAKNIDLTAIEAVIAMLDVSSPTRMDTTANNGIFVGFSDGTNYECFTVGGIGNTTPEPVAVVLTAGQTPSFSGGTPDETAFTRLLAGMTSDATQGTNDSRPDTIWSKFASVNQLTIADGDVGTPASFTQLTSLVNSDHIHIFEVLGNVFSSVLPFTVDAEYFRASNQTIVFVNDPLLIKASADFYYLRIKNSTSTADVELNQIRIQSELSVDVSFGTSDSNASSSLSLNNCSVFASGTSEYFAPAVFVGGAEVDRDRIIFNSGSQVSGRAIGAGTPLQINCNQGDDLRLDARFDLSNNPAIDINAGAGSEAEIDLTGIEWSGTAIIDNISANNTTVLIRTGQSFTTATTGGGTLTVNQPQASFVGSNYADGTRVYLAHQQVFTVAATAVDTVNDNITLGNDANGDAPDFASGSPYTLVRVVLAEGATMPTTSPQIRNRGLYRATVSGGAVSLFVTEASIPATPITFSTSGTNNGGGQLLTLTFETELYNDTVSGGSGLSTALSLSSGARVRRKAIHYSEATSATVTSIPFDDVFVWSATAGISDPAEISNTPNPWIEVNTIAAASIITLRETVTNNSGTDFNSFNPVSTGSTVSGITTALEGVGKIQINANDADGIIWGQELLLFVAYMFSTAAGIRLLSGETVEIQDIAFAAVQNLEVDETSGNFLQIAGVYFSGLTVSSATTGNVALNVATRGVAATIETGTSGLTASEATQLGNLAATLASSGVFSTAALANAPSGGGGGATAQEVWEYSTRSLTDKANFTLATDAVNAASLSADAISEINATVDQALVDYDALVPADLPTNFSALLVTAGGAVTVETVNDKTGYSLTQTFPANFSALDITAEGALNRHEQRWFISGA